MGKKEWIYYLVSMFSRGKPICFYRGWWWEIEELPLLLSEVNSDHKLDITTEDINRLLLLR